MKINPNSSFYNSKFFKWLKGTALGSWASTQASGAITNIQHDRGVMSPSDESKLSLWKKTYGLTDDEAVLIAPLLASGVSINDILSYINQIKSQDLVDQKNSLATQVAEQRAVGINPDLAGFGESPGSSAVPYTGSTGDPLSNGSKASLSSRFDSVASMLFKTISLGLQAYGVVGTQLMKESADILGLASSDVVGLVGDENGLITDVEGALNDLITKRGLTGRKARKYADAVMSSINSVPVAIQRLKNGADYNRALTDLKVSATENSDDVVSNTISFIVDTAKTKASVARCDLQIQLYKEEWLAAHPGVTAQELDLALQNKVNVTRKSSAEADVAEMNVEAKELQNKQLESDVETKISDNEVSQLRNDIAKAEMQGLEDMINFCKRWESWKENHKYLTPGMSRSDFDENDRRYKRYQRYIKRYKGRDKDPKITINTPIGGVSF